MLSLLFLLALGAAVEAASDCQIMHAGIPNISNQTTNACCAQLQITCDANFRITSIIADGTGWTGSFPSNIGQLTKLEALKIVNNGISGVLPDSFYTLPNLRTFQVYKNSISGQLKPAFANMVAMKKFNIGSNQFTGELPDVSSLINMEFFSVDNNGFTGKLPNLCSENLIMLEINDNHLDGALPECFSRLPYLDNIRVQRNHFVGRIPTIPNLIDPTNPSNNPQCKVYEQMIGGVDVPLCRDANFFACGATLPVCPTTFANSLKLESQCKDASITDQTKWEWTTSGKLLEPASARSFTLNLCRPKTQAACTEARSQSGGAFWTWSDSRCILAPNFQQFCEAVPSLQGNFYQYVAATRYVAATPNRCEVTCAYGFRNLPDNPYECVKQLPTVKRDLQKRGKAPAPLQKRQTEGNVVCTPLNYLYDNECVWASQATCLTVEAPIVRESLASEMWVNACAADLTLCGAIQRLNYIQNKMNNLPYAGLVKEQAMVDQCYSSTRP